MEPVDAKDCLIGLRSASGFLKGKLGKNLKLRRIPDLHFKHDMGLQNTLRVKEILGDKAFHAGSSDVS